MSSEVSAVNDDSLFDCANWALETGIWNGREVSWEEGAEFEEEVQSRLIAFLQSHDPNSLEFQQMMARLAWMGTAPENLSLLGRDIQELRLDQEGVVVQAGFCKSISKFWKKHKTAILIGLGVAAVITVAVAVSICTGGAAAGAAAAAGGALKGGDKKKDPEPAPKPSKPIEPAQIAVLEPAPKPTPDFRGSDTKPLYLKDGMVMNGRYIPYSEVLAQEPYPLPSPQDVFAPSGLPNLYPSAGASDNLMKIPEQPKEFLPPASGTKPPATPRFPFISDALRHIGEEAVGPYLLDPMPDSEKITTKRFKTEGRTFPHLGIGGINGINTSVEGAHNGSSSHSNYLKTFTPDLAIDWVYNRTHGPSADVAEVFAFNYAGYSPNTAKLLIETWTQFHEQNQGTPQAKYLQFCHSQGAIHTKNALEKLPPEIQDRVIVVAIAPAAIVPEGICFKSFNYASKKDLVHYGELVHAGAITIGKLGFSNQVKVALENREQLILLDPHEHATDIDHDFQSPTFEKRIKAHVKDYMKRNGAYKCKPE